MITNTSSVHPNMSGKKEINLMVFSRKLWKSRLLIVKVAGIASVIGLPTVPECRLAYAAYAAQPNLAPHPVKVPLQT